MVVRLHIYKRILYYSEGSGQDHSPTPLAERARIAHHRGTNLIFFEMLNYFDSRGDHLVQVVHHLIVHHLSSFYFNWDYLQKTTRNDF